MRLAGKVAIISGAARGMGVEEARMFAREGAKVVIADVLEEEGRKVEAEIGEAGVAAAVARFGKLDVLVNNAAIFGPIAPDFLSTEGSR